MATENLWNTITLPADGDESAEQYTFYKVDADGRADQCTADDGTDLPIGILQNKPAATDRAARLAAVGSISKLVVGISTVNEGDLLRPDSTGRGEATTTDTHFYGAVALTSGATNTLIEVLVTGPQMHAG